MSTPYTPPNGDDESSSTAALPPPDLNAISPYSYWAPPPQQMSPPPPPYQPAMYMIPPLTTPTSGLATAALICGLATFVTFGLTGIAAVICGHLALKRTRTGQHTGNGMAVTGLILGYLSIAGWAIILVTAVIGAATTGAHS